MARPSKTTPVDLTKAQNLTVGTIERLTCPEGKDQAFLRDSGLSGLMVRVTKAGSKSFVFERRINGKSARLTIGSAAAWTIDTARAEARRLAVLLDKGDDPRELDRAKAEAKAHARAEKERAASFTLKALMADYADQLDKLGRSSAGKVRGIFKLHLTEGAPELAAKPAASVTAEDVADLMRSIIENGKERTASKLRAYMRAAFEMARSARTDATLPVMFKSYGVAHNPAADVKAPASRTDKDPLSVSELRQYWQTIEKMQGVRGAVLRLHLLTGGQRIEQLCSLLAVNVTQGDITLMDGKGRPGKPPRAHMLPLTPQARSALDELLTAGRAEGFALSLDGGASRLAPRTFSTWAADAAKLAGVEGFQAKRIRSGVETALASLRVSQETRGHLLSHGVTGVQAASYDGHDYLAEKREALETLHRFLTETSASVTHIAPRLAA